MIFLRSPDATHQRVGEMIEVFVDHRQRCQAAAAAGGRSLSRDGQGTGVGYGGRAGPGGGRVAAAEGGLMGTAFV